jgi:hypothetical protein
VTIELVRTRTEESIEPRCYAVVGVGALCREVPRPGQVFCMTHLAGASLDRQLADARLEQSRTAVLTRAANNLDRMMATLVGIALNPEEDSQARIRAAARVLEAAGILGPRRSAGDVLTQVNVNVSNGDHNVTDADARLLDLIARLGPEGERKAGALRSVIETGTVERSS